MGKTIRYSTEPPADIEQLLALYVSIGWNSIQATAEELQSMCNNSWYVVYAYDEQELVGTGRIISDGVITGVICGLGVLPSYQGRGIGKALLQRLVEHCETHRVFPQLMCVEGLEPYYETMGFERFTIGMTKKIKR